MEIAIIIFALVYFLIITELVNKTTAAMGGAILMVAFGVLTQGQAFRAISFGTIAIVIGILMTVEVVRKAGVFSYLAIKTVKVTKGNPLKLMVMLSLLSYVMSAFLNPVTTIIILGSLTVVVCKELKLSLPPFLIAEDLIAGLGGMTFLISSIANILIAKSAGFSFLFFVSNTLPLVLILLPLTIIFFVFYFKIPNNNEADLSHFDETSAIKNKAMFFGAIAILVLVMTGFAFSETLGVSIEFVALSGGVLALLVSQLEPEKILGKIPWETVFFFSGLFVVIGGLDHSGVLKIFADIISPYVNDPTWGTMAFLWVTSLISGLMDEISLTTAILPVIAALDVPSKISLYWSTVIAANIGSNLTPIGAVSSILALGIARNAGDSINFREFLKVALLLTILQLIVCSIYIYFMY